MNPTLTRIARTVAASTLALCLAMPSASAADPAPFDLTGPPLSVTVTREGKTLPIGAVPNLASGDKLQIGADLPKDQSARYLLISAFLRGATNPPPKQWIQSAETWRKKDKDKLLKLTVPEGARQLVLFLVPDTGGDFDAISDTVRGKPGEFVRATQELNQASLDRSRLDAFMAAIRAQDNTHPEYLRSVAPTLASSLSMKLNDECLDRVVRLQASCLLENRESLVLADVHSGSIAETLSGAPADLALQISSTREAGYGYYSAYIGVVRDIARIFGAFSSPQFDYLPTLALPREDHISLLLNAAPSFVKPKSVLVIALPAIEKDSPPRLRSGANGPICLSRPDAVLPVDGAPLIYSTGYAREMTLQVTPKAGDAVEVPLEARADRGGYVVGKLPRADFTAGMGMIHGLWGFQGFDGPRFDIQFSSRDPWKLADGTTHDSTTMAIGGSSAACVERVTLKGKDTPPRPLTWKATGADTLSVNLPTGGDLSDRVLKVKQYGSSEEAEVVLPVPPPPPLPSPPPAATPPVMPTITPGQAPRP